jgi:hypothetical protein
MPVSKWEQTLKGKTYAEAFRIIWDPKRDLNIKDRKRLVEYHEWLNNKDRVAKQKQLFNKASDPDWWGS